MDKEIKIATLVVSSNTYPAKRNSITQKKIFKLEGFDQSRTFWYKSGTKNELNDEQFLLNYNDLLINTSDSSLNMGMKTIHAFEWLEDNITYDYVVRPTPSSYLNHKNLKKFITDNLTNQEYVYAGKIQSTNNKQGEKIDFVSGSTLILNRNTIKEIIKNKNLWDHSYWDDVALSLLMRELGITPQTGDRFDIEGNPFKQEIPLDQYQYRCRTDNHYGYPRFLESNNLVILHKTLSGKKIGFIKKGILYCFYELAKIIYIHQFGWKIFELSRSILKKLLPLKIYIYIKIKFKQQIENFKHVRFKY
jgi:hypothetical protein